VRSWLKEWLFKQYIRRLKIKILERYIKREQINGHNSRYFRRRLELYRRPLNIEARKESGLLKS
jgi:hypothetical protein